MPQDEIEEITNVKQSQRLYDLWEAYFEQATQGSNDSNNNPFESDLVRRMNILCRHIFGQIHHESAVARDISIYNQLKVIEKAYGVSTKQILALVTKIGGAAVGAGVGVVPGALQIAGPQANIYSSISSGIQSGVVGGTDTINGFFSSLQQGEIETERHKQEINKRQREEDSHKKQQELQATQEGVKDMRESDQKETQAKSEVCR